MKNKKIIRFVMIALFMMIGSVIISSCSLFESSIKTDTETKISFCDSVKLSVKVPVAIPDIPILDHIVTKWNSSEQCFYAHWCYSIIAKKSLLEKITVIVERVTAIVERIIKLFYQIKT